MTVTNTSDGGRGIYMSNAKVELFDVALKGCTNNAYAINMRGSKSNDQSTLVATRCDFSNNFGGISVSHGSAKLTDCTFKSNSMDGICASKNSDVHLHGETTAIANNARYGIHAPSSGKVFIHLPSHHNTSYNNGNEDRFTRNGGTTRITNVVD